MSAGDRHFRGGKATDLPEILWALLSEVASTSGKTRIAVLRMLTARTRTRGDTLAGLLLVAGSAPVIARPVLHLKVRQRLTQINKQRQTNFTPAQMGAISEWILGNTHLLRKLVRSKNTVDASDNITKKEWSSLWNLVTPEQALRLGGF